MCYISNIWDMHPQSSTNTAITEMWLRVIFILLFPEQMVWGEGKLDRPSILHILFPVFIGQQLPNLISTFLMCWDDIVRNYLTLLHLGMSQNIARKELVSLCETVSVYRDLNLTMLVSLFCSLGIMTLISLHSIQILKIYQGLWKRQQIKWQSYKYEVCMKLIVTSGRMPDWTPFLVLLKPKDIMMTYKVHGRWPPEHKIHTKCIDDKLRRKIM